ncbi:hypothetical protein AOQ84DRAFT_112736 [Glonium stellatum]|uniref:Uncharacterized protein n=1 Tax=Glonium stellatum TaxID=574774 RepID=A0A8E2JPF0_9PEZI|nr:hypothetical protein AOQ84DRAFT_112736 [Glonium stellatum]
MPPVLTVKAECRIQAPPVEVFTLLTDLSTWPDWNSFVPSVDIVEPSEGATVHPTLSTETSESAKQRKPIQIGQRLRLHSITGTQKNATIERVTILETPPTAISDLPQSFSNTSRIYRVGWDLESYPRLLLRVSRINEVEEVEGENGVESLYRTKADFNGPLAWGVKLSVSKDLQKGMELMAEGLKKAAERAVQVA